MQLQASPDNAKICTTSPSQCLLCPHTATACAHESTQVCLLDQKYLLDDSLTVRQLLAKAGPKGAPVRLSAFLRVQCGEGLEAQQEGADFAAEVAQMAAGGQ